MLIFLGWEENTMGSAELVLNTGSSTGACTQEGILLWMCSIWWRNVWQERSRSANMPRGRLFSRTNQLSKPHKQRAAEKTCVCMQACTHVQQSLYIQFIWETALDSSSYPALLLGWHAVSLAVRASQLTWQLDLLISVSYTSPFFYFHALFSWAYKSNPCTIGWIWPFKC